MIYPYLSCYTCKSIFKSLIVLKLTPAASERARRTAQTSRASNKVFMVKISEIRTIKMLSGCGTTDEPNYLGFKTQGFSSCCADFSRKPESSVVNIPCVYLKITLFYIIFTITNITYSPKLKENSRNVLLRF